MGVSRLQGTPWHTERMHRKDGDDRRYKGRCIFYNHITEQCKNNWKCRGSRYCQDYEPMSDDEFRQRQEDTAVIKRLLSKGYNEKEISSLLEQKKKQKKNQKKTAEAKKQEVHGIPKRSNDNQVKPIPPAMALPNLQGKQIIHNSYGEGTVLEQSGDYIFVDYNGVKKKQSLTMLLKAGLIDCGKQL